MPQKSKYPIVKRNTGIIYGIQYDILILKNKFKVLPLNWQAERN